MIESNTVDLEKLSTVFYNDSSIFKPKLVINNSIFYQNFGEDGGAISILQYETFINNSTFIENYGFRYGGAIFFSSNVITIQSSIFIRNAASYGGAIFLSRQPFPIMEEKNIFTAITTIFYNNLATSSGGAVYYFEKLFDFAIFVTNCYFFKNAALLGGALCFMNRNDGNNHFLNSTFFHNLADYGGAMYIQSNSVFLFENCVFLANAAINFFFKLVKILEFFFEYIMNQLINNFIAPDFSSEFIIGDPIFVDFASLDSIILNDSDFENPSTIGGVMLFDVYFDPKNITSIKNMYKRNFALEKGGVAVLVSGNFTDYESKFLENNAGSEGGAFDVEDTSILTLFRSIFRRNSAKDLYFLF